MQKADKERVVEELTERLRSSEALLVADYRGLTNSQLAGLRVELLSTARSCPWSRTRSPGGRPRLPARRRCWPCSRARRRSRSSTSDGDPVAVAKALTDAARDTKILALARRCAVGQPDHGGGDREAREAPAARRAPGSARRGDRGPADPARGGAERAAAEPGRPDRRQDHAARGERRRVGGRGRGAGCRGARGGRAAGRRGGAEASAKAESPAPRSRPPRPKPRRPSRGDEDTPEA